MDCQRLDFYRLEPPLTKSSMPRRTGTIRFSRWRNLQIALLLLGLIVLPVTSVNSQQPDADLSYLVPSDVGVCIEGHEIVSGIARFVQSDLFQRFLNFQPFAKWYADTRQQLEDQDDFRQAVGAAPQELYELLFSRNLLLAAWPADGGENSVDRTLLIVQVSDAKKLQSVLRRLGELPSVKSQGDAALPLQIDGQSLPVLVVRPRPDGAAIHIVADADYCLMASDRKLLEETLRARRAGRIEHPLAEEPNYQEARKEISPRAIITLFANPRAFDRSVQEQIALFAGVDSKQTLWHSLRYAVLSLDLDEDVRLHGSIRWNADTVPEPSRLAISALAGKLDFLNHVPSNAVFVLAGRFELGALGRAFREELSSSESGFTIANAQQRFMEQLILTAINQLGPDIGIFLVPRDEHDESEGAPPKSDAAFDWVFGINSPAPTGQGKEPGTVMLMNGIGPFLKGILSLARIQATIDVTRQDGYTYSTIVAADENQSPLWEVSYATLGTYLWAGSTPGVMRLLANRSENSNVELQGAFAALLAHDFPLPTHVMLVDLRLLRNVLKNHPDLAKLVAAGSQMDVEQANSSISNLGAVLKLADTIAALGRIEENGFEFLVHVGVDPAADAK